MPENATITLCADDFGLSYGVSAGILEALQAGRLSAVSALTNAPRWSAMGRDLLRGGFDADIGLHFNLTLGRPLGPMPIFAPQGAFPPVKTVISAAKRGRLPVEEIRAELRRQLDRFEAIMERAPDFVDGHQHVQTLPQIRGALLETLAARRLQGKCWLRCSGDRPERILLRRGRVVKALIVAGLSYGFAKAARRAGFATNDGFAGFSDFDPRKDYGAQFAGYLRARGPRHLIMCHPGHVDEELRAQDPVTESREQELAFLLSPRFNEMLEGAGVKLARLSPAAA